MIGHVVNFIAGYGRTATGFTSVGNVNTTVTRWRNWSNQYTSITKEDFVRKARKAATFTFFMSPTPIPTYNTGDTFGFFTTYAVRSALEELAERQNDQLGNDVASKDGMVLLRGNPVIWAPYLENKASGSDPFYGINWGLFKPTYLAGWFLRENGLQVRNDMHTTLNAHVDVTMNYLVRDRRRQFILAKSDPAA